MREIKFRGWHKFVKQMFFPVKLHLKDGRCTAFDVGGDDGIYVVKTGNPNYGLDIMQYTGLKDKNGKEIYEGDIVFCDAIEEKGVIKWGKYSFRCKTESTRSDDGFMPYEDSMEIIGNIYENPELLKEE